MEFSQMQNKTKSSYPPWQCSSKKPHLILILLAESNWSSLENWNLSWAKAPQEQNGQSGLREIQTALCTFLCQWTWKTTSFDWRAKLLDTLKFHLLLHHWPPDIWPTLATCLSWQPSSGGLHTAVLCPKSGFAITVNEQLQDQPWRSKSGGRWVTFQEPGKHHYPTCKCPSCDLLESLHCQAAAPQEETVGFSFFTMQIWKEKLIKPLPEVRMHQ